MYQDDSGLEQRLSRFEAQLDRFSLALRQWQETQSQSPAAGPPDLDQRIRALEETITREALALRQIHEEPLKQLQGQAESLGDLSRSLQSLVTDLRIGTGASTSQGSAASWPLERVVNLHDELRRGANSGGSQGVHSETPLPEAAGPPSRRVRLLQPPNDLETAPPHAIESRTLRTPGRYAARVAAVAAGLVMVVAGFWWIESRLDEASARVAAAERQVMTTSELANREVVAARQDADRQIAEARQLAQRAETVGVILTAPDLIRFNLTNGETVGPSAQLLWSLYSGARAQWLTPPCRSGGKHLSALVGHEHPVRRRGIVRSRRGRPGEPRGRCATSGHRTGCRRCGHRRTNRWPADALRSNPARTHSSNRGLKAGLQTRLCVSNSYRCRLTATRPGTSGRTMVFSRRSPS